MRFQTTRVIQREDPQLVLHALEISLRQLSLDVVLDGSAIILHGLGPSPRIINHRDAAILRVDTEANRTIIKADITFQPSCLLGDSPQVEAVSYKLDRVFDQMSNEISLERQRKAQPSITAAVLTTLQHPGEATSLPQSIKLTPALSFIARNAPIAVFSKQEPDRTPSDEHAAKTSPRVDQLQPFAFHETNWRTFLIAATCIALLFYSYLTFRNRIHVGAPRNLSHSPLSTNKPRSAPPPMTNPAVGIVDPLEWLGRWVAAMRTRDPFVQASFYSDQVDNYLGEKNVSKARIIAKKKTAIERRTSLWTIKLEELVLIKESATSIKVNLVKHTIAQNRAAEISERRVRCHLHLRRTSGVWQIISEEDFQ